MRRSTQWGLAATAGIFVTLIGYQNCAPQNGASRVGGVQLQSSSSSNQVNASSTNPIDTFQLSNVTHDGVNLSWVGRPPAGATNVSYHITITQAGNVRTLSAANSPVPAPYNSCPAGITFNNDAVFEVIGQSKVNGVEVDSAPQSFTIPCHGNGAPITSPSSVPSTTPSPVPSSTPSATPSPTPGNTRFSGSFIMDGGAKGDESDMSVHWTASVHPSGSPVTAYVSPQANQDCRGHDMRITLTPASGSPINLSSATPFGQAGSIGCGCVGINMGGHGVPACNISFVLAGNVPLGNYTVSGTVDDATMAFSQPAHVKVCSGSPGQSCP